MLEKICALPLDVEVFVGVRFDPAGDPRLPSTNHTGVELQAFLNGLAKQNISLDAKDHDFYLHKAEGFKPMVKGNASAAAAKAKPGPNAPCHCGSGKKYKKCCLQEDNKKL